MLGAGSCYLGSEEAARDGIGVEATEATIPSHDPAAPLILEAHLPHHDVAVFRELLEAWTDHGQLRLAEGDLQTRAPNPWLHVRVACGVVAGDPPLVDGLVEDGDAVARVSARTYLIATAQRPTIANDGLRMQGLTADSGHVLLAMQTLPSPLASETHAGTTTSMATSAVTIAAKAPRCLISTIRLLRGRSPR